MSRNEGNGGGAGTHAHDSAATSAGDEPRPGAAPPPASAAEESMYMDAFGSELWARNAQPPEDACGHELPSDDASASAAEALAELAMSQLQHGIEAAEAAEHAAEEAAELTESAMGVLHHHRDRHAAPVAASKEAHAAPAAPRTPPAASAAADALETTALVAAKRAAEAAAVTAKAEAALAALYASRDAAEDATQHGLADSMGPRAEQENATVEMGQRVPVSFQIQRHVSYGERVVLVGSGPALGNWQLRSGVELCWSVGDVWRTPAPLLLCVDDTLVYKYVVLHGSGDDAPASWQKGANNVLMLSADDAPALRVVDSWTADPLESRVIGGAGPSQRSAGPAERLAAVAAARRSELKRAHERADTAEAALERERLSSRTLRAEVSLAAGLRAQLRRLLQEEQRRTALLQREVAAFRDALRGFRAQLSKRIGIAAADPTEAR